MAARQATRRQFIAWSSGLMAGLTMGLARLEPATAAAPHAKSVVIYRLSARGRRGVSRAAKCHAANKRFRTQQAAQRHRLYAGDRCRIVPLTVSQGESVRLFVHVRGGRRIVADVADLRHPA